MKKKFNLLILIVIILIITIYCKTYRYEMEIEDFTYEELRKLESFEKLSVYDIVRLAQSKKLLNEIFETRDTSINVFKNQIINNYRDPIFFITPNQEFKVTTLEKNRLRKLLRAKNESYQIISSLAPFCVKNNSSVSTEVQFILRRIREEKIFCSSELIKYEKLSYLLYYLKF